MKRTAAQRAGIWCTESKDSFLPSLAERIMWRLAAAKVVHPKSRKTIVDQNEEIDEEKAKQIVAAGIRPGLCQVTADLPIEAGGVSSLLRPGPLQGSPG